MKIFAKKSLGQNFLHDMGAIESIISSAKLSADDTVLEVGPGKGVLTDALLKSAGKVIVVEKDDRLVPLLNEKFASAVQAGKLIIVHEDILEFSPEKYGLTPGEFKLVANIPYYITGELFKRFLETGPQPKDIVLLVQKEVAERVVDEKGSILSVSVKAYGTPKYIRKVKASSFSPEPGVDSAILAIYDISKKSFRNLENGAHISETEFFSVLKAGFAHKRKKLISNLAETYPKEALLVIWKTLELGENTRAEDINTEKWLKITAFLNKAN